jgi:hypothetical protein
MYRVVMCGVEKSGHFWNEENFHYLYNLIICIHITLLIHMFTITQTHTPLRQVVKMATIRIEALIKKRNMCWKQRSVSWFLHHYDSVYVCIALSYKIGYNALATLTTGLVKYGL